MERDPKAPVVLHLAVGQRCNNRCIFCLDRGRGLLHDFSLEDLTGQLERGLALSNAVVMTNAEPTLNPVLVPTVRAARRLGYQDIGLVTNGRRLKDAALCRALIDAGLNTVTMSIHGPTAAVHDVITQREGSFDEAIQGLRNLAQAREGNPLRIKVSCTVVKQNLSGMSEMYAFVQPFGVEQLTLNVVEPRGRVEDDFKAMVPRYTAVIDAADASGLPFDTSRVSLARVPACAGGFEWLQEDYRFTHGGEASRYEPEEGKAKGVCCEGCVADNRCPGVWKGYADVYGWDEFTTILSPETRVDEVLRVRLDAPCNNHCVHCDDGPASSKSEPLAPVSRQLRRGVLRGYRQVELGGGEPLLYKGLPEAVQLARQLGYQRIGLVSNGRMIRHATIDWLRQAGVHEVVLRLHAGHPQLHDELTRTAGSFRQTLRGMAKLARASFPFSVRIRKVTQNADSVAQAREISLAIGAQRFEIL